MKKPLKRKVLSKALGGVYVFMLILCMVMLIAFPDRYVPSAAEGLKVWAITVAPSLLPFFFLTALLAKTECVSAFSDFITPLGKIAYRSDGLSVYLQLTSFLSGYPIGAKTIAELNDNGVISASQAEKYSVTSSTSGPLFIVGGIGISMFGDKRVGFSILLCHLLSSVLTGIAFRGLKADGARALSRGKSVDNALYESIYSSVISVAIVGGFIAVFYTFARIALDIKLLSPLVALLSPFLGSAVAEGFTIGLIECTTGIKAISLGKATAINVALSCALVSFGGLSVWCQSLIYLSKTGARTRVFVLSKVVHAALSFITCYIFFTLVN